MKWLIKLCGGYTRDEYVQGCLKDYQSGLNKEAHQHLQNERNRLTYLLSESKKGRMVNKIQNELTNVTNQILRMEDESV